MNRSRDGEGGVEFVGIWKCGGMRIEGDRSKKGRRRGWEQSLWGFGRVGGGGGDEGDMSKKGRRRGWEQKQEGQE